MIFTKRTIGEDVTGLVLHICTCKEAHVSIKEECPAWWRTDVTICLPEFGDVDYGLAICRVLINLGLKYALYCIHMDYSELLPYFSLAQIRSLEDVAATLNVVVHNAPESSVIKKEPINPVVQEILRGRKIEQMKEYRRRQKAVP